MAGVTFVGATHIYPGNDVPAVKKLDLDVADGEFMVLVGPSGSGKSTALRMLAGLEEVSDGAILIGEEDVTRTAPKHRDVAMVFQNYALYPHMSVADNMGFALKLAGVSKEQRMAKVREAAGMLDLADYLTRKPKALSGGQRQRVAMGRAIVREPRAFLMDEPLSNLDAKLRVETRANIAALQARLGTTTVYVTHDQVEAMTMGHRVAVLRDGVLQQVATPRELYQHPVNSFVATFIGSPAMNLRTALLSADGVRIGDVDIPVASSLRQLAGSAEVVVGVRPEAVNLTTVDDPAGLKLQVDLVEELGADAYLYGTLATDSRADKPFIARVASYTAPSIGETVSVSVDIERVYLFRSETGVRISSDT